MEVVSKCAEYEREAQALQGPALVDLILKAIDEPGMVHFGGLLGLASVQQARAADALRQELTAAQEKKLRVLTVLSLAADQRVLGYEEIRSALGLPGLDEAEDLLIQDVVGPGLIKGRLDQPGERLLIVSSTPRDVEQSRLAGVADQLSSWLEAMDGALAALGQARQATEQGASALASSRAEQAAQEQAARRAVAETPSQMPSAFDNASDGPGGALGGEESEAMPFEGVTPQGPRLSKRRR